jgi:F420-dependent oxidoreductase-like protein
MARVGRAAEEIGAGSLSMMDHFFHLEPFFPARNPVLEGYTTLGFLAAHTSSVRLRMLVTGMTYRHPGLLAKIVTTLDVLSGGRAELGIGAAWYEREHRGLGVPFPPLTERFERLEETLQICRQMWSPDDGPFEGRYYRLAETLCSPKPVSQPRPRVLVGGGGERKTLRLVALYGDACNLNIRDDSSAEVAHKLDVLRRHCDDVGRDFAQITPTITYNGGALAAGDFDGFLRLMAGYSEVGFRAVMVIPPAATDPAGWIESSCGPVIEQLRELG